MIAILNLKNETGQIIPIEFALSDQLIDPLVSRIAKNFTTICSAQLILTNTEGKVFSIRYYIKNGKLIRRYI